MTEPGYDVPYYLRPPAVRDAREPVEHHRTDRPVWLRWLPGRCTCGIRYNRCPDRPR